MLGAGAGVQDRVKLACRFHSRADTGRLLDLDALSLPSSTTTRERKGMGLHHQCSRQTPSIEFEAQGERKSSAKHGGFARKKIDHVSKIRLYSGLACSYLLELLCPKKFKSKTFFSTVCWLLRRSSFSFPSYKYSFVLRRAGLLFICIKGGERFQMQYITPTIPENWILLEMLGNINFCVI